MEYLTVAGLVGLGLVLFVACAIGLLFYMLFEIFKPPAHLSKHLWGKAPEPSLQIRTANEHMSLAKGKNLYIME